MTVQLTLAAQQPSDARPLQYAVRNRPLESINAQQARAPVKPVWRARSPRGTWVFASRWQRRSGEVSFEPASAASDGQGVSPARGAQSRSVACAWSAAEYRDECANSGRGIQSELGGYTLEESIKAGRGRRSSQSTTHSRLPRALHFTLPPTLVLSFA